MHGRVGCQRARAQQNQGTHHIERDEVSCRCRCLVVPLHFDSLVVCLVFRPEMDRDARKRQDMRSVTQMVTRSLAYLLARSRGSADDG